MHQIRLWESTSQVLLKSYFDAAFRITTYVFLFSGETKIPRSRFHYQKITKVLW